MQVTTKRSSPRRSVTAAARRTQIVDATIATIADLGYARSSFARIAERAGLSSTRLISYHFANKQELMAQVAADVYADIAAFMTERLSGQRTAAGALREYIAGNIDYLATHRRQMAALLDIFLSGVLTEGEQTTAGLVAVDAVERILRDGQASGEFRSFDATVLAACIQRSIDAVPMLLPSHPDLDLHACAVEMTTLFDLGTRAAATGQ